jgi:G3E family GTPase
MLTYKNPITGPEKGVVAMPGRVPVFVVTGYLGSGKTTLIAELLKAPDMVGTAVIVNELAEIGIDQAVIGDGNEAEVVLLSNGCLCCGRGTDLSNTVRRLIGGSRSGGQKLERILIETSGAADPAPILRQICFEPQLRNHLRYGGVLCLFDTMFGEGLLLRDPVGYRQIALADMVLLTKTDLSGSDACDEARHKIGSLNGVAAITADRRMANAFLAGHSGSIGRAGSQSWLGTAVEAEEMSHPQEIGTWTVRIQGAIDWTRAELSMRNVYDRLGDAVLRTKGLIHTKGDPRPLVIHGINRHFHRPLRLKDWDGEPETRIVIIGLEQAGQAASEITRLLQQCAEPAADKRAATA